jgi:hypothetical protein
MAVRTPLYFNDDQNLQELTSAEISQIKLRMYNLYINNPSVSLSYVSSGGTVGTISDTRLIAGNAATSISAFPEEITTEEPSVFNVNYSRINQTIDTVSQPPNIDNVQYPVYYNINGNLQSMTLQDMYDTFAFDVINELNIGGVIYTISTETSITDYTLVDAIPVFTNTSTNTSLYSAAGIAETLDQPETLENYYLHKRNPDLIFSYNVPVRLTSSGDIETPDFNTFDSILEDVVRYTAANVPDNRLRFGYNLEDGNNCGTAMIDTRLNGSGDYQTLFVGADDYRAQEFPNGSETTINTYSLTIRKE